MRPAVQTFQSDARSKYGRYPNDQSQGPETSGTLGSTDHDKVDLTLGLEEGSMHCFTPKFLSICYASIREASHDLYKPTLV